VLCAARSRDEFPVLHGAWLTPGATVVSIGSTLPEQREVDEETLARSALVVADVPDEVLHDTGDGRAASKSGIDLASKLVSLADLAGGRCRGRTHPSDIVIYKSVGSALQDIVLAEMFLDRARVEGLGVFLPASIAPLQK
jgi:ornithine cyclodeaminase/alanine dehydrogenase